MRAAAEQCHCNGVNAGHLTIGAVFSGHEANASSWAPTANFRRQHAINHLLVSLLIRYAQPL